MTRNAQSGSGTPSVRPGAMRGPATSREKLPLPMTTTRSGAGQEAMARATAWPNAWQRCADGSGGTWPLMKKGMTGTFISGVRKCNGTAIEWSTE